MISKEKKIWMEQEDLILKKLYEEQNLRNWSEIAKKMASQYNLPRKSAKQCRERYENHISTETSKIQWTIEEDLLLITLHNDIGNKWSNIAQRIEGKSDNCVKNHFYSKLRKILRKLNTVIHQYFKKEFRQININVIYKIVEACEQKFKDQPNCDRRISFACQEIQNKMLNISMLREEELDSIQRIAIYKEVIKEIYQVSKMYKRKSKKSRNSSIQAPNNKGLPKKKRNVFLNAEEGYASDRSNAFDEEEESRNGESIQFSEGGNVIKQKISEEDAYASWEIQNKINAAKLFKHSTTTQAQLSKPNDVVMKEQPNDIKDILQIAGALCIDPSEGANHSAGFKFSSKSSFKSFSDKSDKSKSEKEYFEESDRERNPTNYYHFQNLDDPSEKSERDYNGDLYNN